MLQFVTDVSVEQRSKTSAARGVWVHREDGQQQAGGLPDTWYVSPSRTEGSGSFLLMTLLFAMGGEWSGGAA